MDDDIVACGYGLHDAFLRRRYDGTFRVDVRGARIALYEESPLRNDEVTVTKEAGETRGMTDHVRNGDSLGTIWRSPFRHKNQDLERVEIAELEV